MKRVNFYGLRRSGHHAIIFWLINNLGGCEETLYSKEYFNKKENLYYINDITTHEAILPTDYNWLITNVEDKLFNRSENGFVIVRDFYNLLCSRYKHYNENIGFDRSQYISNIYYLIMVWKQNVKTHLTHKQKVISYNEWLTSKEYRNEVSSRFSILNTIDNIDYVPIMGGGSSFIGIQKEQDVQRYFERYKQVDLPSEMLDVINKDKELIDLNLQYFDIKNPAF
jgi:hypothetical protein